MGGFPHSPVTTSPPHLDAMKQHDSANRPLLSSPRELRLWLWTLAALVAIFSTLGLTPAAAEELRDNGLAGAAMFLGLIGMGSAVVITAFRARPSRTEIGVLLGIGAVYLVTFIRINIPEERTHLFEYSIVALLIYEALTERADQGRRVPWPALLAFLATASIGLLDEVVQSFIPERVFDPIDIMFNTLAALMTVGAIATLRRMRGH